MCVLTNSLYVPSTECDSRIGTRRKYIKDRIRVTYSNSVPGRTVFSEGDLMEILSTQENNFQE